MQILHAKDVSYAQQVKDALTKAALADGLLSDAQAELQVNVET